VSFRPAKPGSGGVRGSPSSPPPGGIVVVAAGVPEAGAAELRAMLVSLLLEELVVFEREEGQLEDGEEGRREPGKSGQEPRRQGIVEAGEADGRKCPGRDDGDC